MTYFDMCVIAAWSFAIGWFVAVVVMDGPAKEVPRLESRPALQF